MSKMTIKAALANKSIARGVDALAGLATNDARADQARRQLWGDILPAAFARRFTAQQLLDAALVIDEHGRYAWR